VQLTPDASEALDELWAGLKKVYAEKNAVPTSKNPAVFGDEIFLRLREYIASPETYLKSDGWINSPPMERKLWLRFALSKEVTLPFFFKTMRFLALDFTAALRSGIINELFKATGSPTLLELQQLIEVYRFSAEELMWWYCGWRGEARDWPDQAVLPFMAHNVELLKKLLIPPGPSWSIDREWLFKAITMLPQPPESVVDPLLNLALKGKQERVLAHMALAKLPDKEARIIAALADGKADLRVGAAQWLGQIAYAPALTALEQAYSKEKNDLAKGAMLDALEQLGQPVEKISGSKRIDERG